MITDLFLNEIAKNINGESSSAPSHCAFSSTVITPDATDTSLAQEWDRSSATGSRVSNVVTLTAIRSGAIASSTGDAINALGLFTAASGGTLLAEATVPNILHSDTFDLETEWRITVSRK